MLGIIESNKSPLTQRDPRDALRHAQSPIALYTMLYVECHQLATVDRRLLTTLCYVHRRQILPTKDRPLSFFIALWDGGIVVAKFCKSRVSDKIPAGSTLIFGDTAISLSTIKDLLRKTCMSKTNWSRYNTGLWQTESRTQTHCYYCASLASRE